MFGFPFIKALRASRRSYSHNKFLILTQFFCVFSSSIFCSILRLFTSPPLQWHLNPGRTIANRLSWRKHVKLGLRRLNLMKMGRKSALTFPSICHLLLGILMLRNLV